MSIRRARLPNEPRGMRITPAAKAGIASGPATMTIGGVDTVRICRCEAQSPRSAARFGPPSQAGISARPMAMPLNEPLQRSFRKVCGPLFVSDSPYLNLPDTVQPLMRIDSSMRIKHPRPAPLPTRHIEAWPVNGAPSPHRARTSNRAAPAAGAPGQCWPGNFLRIRIRLSDVAVVRKARTSVMSVMGHALKTPRDNGEPALFHVRRYDNPVAAFALTFAAGPSVPTRLKWREHEYMLSPAQPMAVSVPQRTPDAHA